MNIENNIRKITENLPEGCRLVAVSKTQSPEKIQMAYAAGQRIFGENKVQELLQKRPALPDEIEWHMIGHLQRNKVKHIAEFVNLIHSVDSGRLLEEIDRQGARVPRVIPCLLQIHIAEEETKFGFDAVEVRDLLLSERVAEMKNVEVRGLMGMATYTEDEEKIRMEFRNLRKIFEDLKTLALPGNVRLTELSMGMSNDYRIAIEEGSTLIRVGSAIFGERN